jgi:hypothetical protein
MIGLPLLPSAPRRGRAFAAPAAPILFVLLAAAAGVVRADDAPPSDDEAFYQRAATCAAAMEVDQLSMARRARAGETELRDRIVRLTEYGFAYVGTAYKRGLRNPRADEMLKTARAEQKGWDAARHAKVASECTAEGEALFNGATSLEQWLVTSKANKRVDRFLNAPAPASAPASQNAASR